MAKSPLNSLEDVWLIRPCEVYKEEYHDCRSWRSRMYQNYVDGQKTDCSQWLQDFNNCMAFRNKKDLMAAEALITVEQQRRKERLINANANDVWEYRKSPPPEWSAPLGFKNRDTATAS